MTVIGFVLPYVGNMAVAAPVEINSGIMAVYFLLSWRFLFHIPAVTTGQPGCSTGRFCFCWFFLLTNCHLCTSRASQFVTVCELLQLVIYLEFVSELPRLREDLQMVYSYS